MPLPEKEGTEKPSQKEKDGTEMTVRKTEEGTQMPLRNKKGTMKKRLRKKKKQENQMRLKGKVKKRVPSARVYQLSLRWFMSLNLLYICFGPCLYYLIHLVGVDSAHQDKALKLITDFNKVPASLLYTSAEIFTLNGLFGIFATFFDYPYVFDSYEGFMFLALALNGVASVMGAISPSRISKKSYEGIFRAETKHLTDHKRFKGVGSKDHMWDSIQETLQCCGLSNQMDWILSSLNGLPMSCCNTKDHKNKKDCASRIGINVTLGTDMKRLSREIYPLLWRQGCIERIQDLLIARKKLWTGVPLILLVCEGFILFLCSYFADFIRVYTEYVAEEKLRRNAENPELAKLKSKQLKYHLIPPRRKKASVGSHAQKE